MSEQPIRFNDGAAYEAMMGTWSRFAGDIFLDWLAPSPGLRWVDVGCGNGAFTARLVARCAPAAVDGIDPSPAQLAFARARPDVGPARFHSGDAMALPFGPDSYDAAVMALVIFFVPEPERGVAEMVRVVKPGGMVAAYAWDMMGGRSPMEPIWDGMRAIGIKPTKPPRAEASRLDALRALWTGAGLVEVETRAIEVTRSFRDAEEVWAVTSPTPLDAARDQLRPGDVERLREHVLARLPVAADGSVTYAASAHAVKGRLPG
jgi:SAM-dependent methyltransferase